MTGVLQNQRPADDDPESDPENVTFDAFNPTWVKAPPRIASTMAATRIQNTSPRTDDSTFVSQWTLMHGPPGQSFAPSFERSSAS